MSDKQKLPRSFWIGFAVLLIIISLTELVVIVLEYQNNVFLRQYVSENSARVYASALGVVVLGVAAALLTSRKTRPVTGVNKQPVFARLGNLVINRRKLIVAIWIILLIVAVPASQRLSEATTSRTGGAETSLTDSDRAQHLIEEQFTHQQSNSSAIILVQSKDVTDDGTKRFVVQLEDTLMLDGTLAEAGNFTSIYSVERQIITQTALALSPSIRGLEATTTVLNGLLFGVPEGYVQMWKQANFTSFIVYGIPSIYLTTWYSTTGSSISERDSIANQTTYAQLSSFSTNQTIVALVSGYYMAFFGHWATTVSNTTLTSDPPLRASQAINATIPLFVQGLTDPMARNMFTGVWQSFNLNTWNQPESVNNFVRPTALAIFSQQFSDPRFLPMLNGYYTIWTSNWDASFDNPSTQGLTPDQRLVANLSNSIFTFASTLSGDPQTSQLITAIASTFDITTAFEPQAIHRFAIAQVQLAATGFGLKSALPQDFLESVYALGPNPTASTAEDFARGIIDAGSISTYPIPIPADLLRSFVSPDKTTMLLIVTFTRSPSTFGSPQSDPILNDVVVIRNTVSDLNNSSDSVEHVYVTGNVATTADAALSNAKDLGLIEPITIASILVLVGLFFLAIVTPFVPLISIGVALIIAQGIIYIIGKYIVPVQDTTLTFLFTIMLGVGTDYAIFLMARYREERIGAAERSKAVLTSVTWSGESIATSALTVILAFGALALSSFSMLQSMGIALGLGVLIALLVSLTLIPALLILVGDKAFWPMSGRRFQSYAAKVNQRRAERPSYFRRAASFSVKKPVLVLGLAVLVSIPAIYISFTGETTHDFIAGLPQAESIQGLQVLEQSFGAGQIGPTQVVVHFQTTILRSGSLTGDSSQALETLSQSIASIPNVKEVTGPTRPNGTPVNVTNVALLDSAQRQIVLNAIGRDNSTALITVIFSEEPFTHRSMDTVTEIRNTVSALQKTDSALAQAAIYVGGTTASTLDFSVQTENQFLIMRIVVVAGIFLILLAVLGSYPLALTGILSIGLSITWAYAATLLFFNNILQSEVLFIIPLVLFLLLYGIGMDYNIFILTRIREEAQKGKETRQAVVDAVDRTGGIITALALILAGAIGSLLLSSNRLLQGFGFAISLAVILDAMVVRTYLVPAAMSLLGDKAWWGPSRLRRVKNRAQNKTPSNVSSP